MTWFPVGIYAWNFSKNLSEMGNCLRAPRRDVCITIPPAAARERLENLCYDRWRDFTEDLVLAYGNLQLKFSVDLELRVQFRDGDSMLIIHTIGFNDYVLWSNLDYTQKQLSKYMSSPYYYLDNSLHFYSNIVSCKKYVIKKFVIHK
jgi:hypothetical protein